MARNGAGSRAKHFGIEDVGYHYVLLEKMLKCYNPADLRSGFDRREGEEFFYISNPGLGLWAHGDRLSR